MNQNYAAIDMGSNALRLIIGEWNTDSQRMRILKKIREPVRLGHDSFLDGEIANKTQLKVVKAFDLFKAQLKKFDVKNCRAVATSAVREAKNRDEFMSFIQKETGIKIHIIEGDEEAEIIYVAVKNEIDLARKKVIAIDIGGGSVEISLSENARLVATQSFKMGTVRLLERLVKNKMDESHLNLLIGEFIEPLHSYLDSHLKGDPVAFAVGTGGNIECLGRLKLQLLGKTPNTFVTLSELNDIINRVKSFTVQERMQRLEMRPDRADVILPASFVLQTILSQLGVEKLVIPYVGLRDGILWQMAKAAEGQKTR